MTATASIYVALALLGVVALLAALCAWYARRAYRSSVSARSELIDLNRRLSAINKSLGAELRGARQQLSNVLQLLLAAGFKKKRHGWEDDCDATQQREAPQDMSWWRPKR